MSLEYQTWCVIRYDTQNVPGKLVKILGATSDNMSSNDTMSEHMGKMVTLQQLSQSSEMCPAYHKFSGKEFY